MQSALQIAQLLPYSWEVVWTACHARQTVPTYRHFNTACIKEAVKLLIYSPVYLGLRSSIVVLSTLEILLPLETLHTKAQHVLLHILMVLLQPRLLHLGELNGNLFLAPPLRLLL
jgi:hypothetical protein